MHIFVLANICRRQTCTFVCYPTFIVGKCAHLCVIQHLSQANVHICVLSNIYRRQMCAFLCLPTFVVGRRAHYFSAGHPIVLM